MMTFRRIALLFLLSVMAGSTPAFAQSYFNGTAVVACPGNDEKSVMIRATNCVEVAIVQATQIFLQHMSDIMFPITISFITLLMIFFGVRILIGEGEVTKKAFTFILKIGVVLLMTDNFGGFMMNAFDASGQLQTVIVKALPYDINCQATGANITAPAAYISAGGVQVWAALDCLLGRILGYGPTFILPASIFGMLGSVVGAGSMGVMCFFIGVAALLSLIFFVLRAVFVFLVSYMQIGFLIIISPLIIPLLLFGPTTPAFETWFRNLLAAIAMPGLVFAYLCIMMPVLDDAIDGQRTIAVQKQLGTDQQIQSRYRNNAQKCSMSRPTDASFTRATPGINMPDVYNSLLRDYINPSRSSGTDTCSMLSMPSADFGEKTPGVLWDIGVSLIKLLIVALLLTNMMKVLPDMVYAIFGGGSGFLTAVNAPLPLEEKMKMGFAKAKNAAMSSSGGSRGIGGFLEGFMRR